MCDHIMCPNDTDIWEKTSAQLLSLAFSVLVARDVYSDDVTIKRHNTALLVVESFKLSSWHLAVEFASRSYVLLSKFKSWNGGISNFGQVAFACTTVQ